MSFKENLKRKIKIDRLAHQVINPLMPTGDYGRKIDKGAMRALLEAAGYKVRVERDVEIHAHDFTSTGSDKVVLDNELKDYQTTVDDLVLRKNPVVKEMISIKNAIKILNDKDVVVASGLDTVKKIQQECIDQLDLTYTEADITALAEDGRRALKSQDVTQVEEILDLFGEILDLKPPPKKARKTAYKILGGQANDADGREIYGPVVIYNRLDNKLVLVDSDFQMTELQEPATSRDLVSGKILPDMEGEGIFDFLRKKVLTLPGKQVAA